MKTVNQAVKLFVRATERLLREVHRLRVEQTALETLAGKDHIGLDFFKVAHTALLGDRLIRLIRIFEDSKTVASFWYLYRCGPRQIEQFLTKTQVKPAKRSI